MFNLWLVLCLIWFLEESSFDSALLLINVLMSLSLGQCGKILAWDFPEKTSLLVNEQFYYVAELVHNKEENSDWSPKEFKFFGLLN